MYLPVSLRRYATTLKILKKIKLCENVYILLTVRCRLNGENSTLDYRVSQWKWKVETPKFGSKFKVFLGLEAENLNGPNSFNYEVPRQPFQTVGVHCI